MSVTRQAQAGATRTCPHCRATVLESAVVCPGCRHHLRAGTAEAKRALTTFTALSVEGKIQQPGAEDAYEYSVVVTVRDERGAELTRQVVGVGSMRADEVRAFSVDVQVYVPK